MLSLLAAITQFERDLILERQRECITLAKQRGIYKGRQSKFTLDDIALMKTEFASTSNLGKLAKRMGYFSGVTYTASYTWCNKRNIVTFKI